jgi:hypothetical protein
MEGDVNPLPDLNDIKKIKPVIPNQDSGQLLSKPVLAPELTTADYKNLAKKFFLENFQDILKLGISGNVFRLTIVGIILAVLILFGLGIF